MSNSLTLGIDLGGTKILTAVVDAQGKILAWDNSETPAEKGPEAVISAMTASAGRAMDGARVGLEDIDAVGIGAPGPSNPEKGILFTSPNLPGWQNIAVTETFENKFNKRVFLINDANAAALAEHRYGAATGLRHVIYITISTGIGGGIIIDGNLYTGAIGTAAELGHMTINDEGPLCNCGNFGCWEALASGTALEREARRRIREGTRTTIPRYVVNHDEIDAKSIYQAALEGDGLAMELIETTGYYFGVGLANLLNMFNPEMIVIGGGLSNMGDMLLDPAIKTAKARSYAVAFASVRFAPAKLGKNSGVLGAAAFAREKLQ
ncbi:MAG: ROK family protein [Desulfobacterales bacterium]